MLYSNITIKSLIMPSECWDVIDKIESDHRNYRLSGGQTVLKKAAEEKIMQLRNRAIELEWEDSDV